MELVEHNVYVLAVATALLPGDCYFCGHQESEHIARGKGCPVTRQAKEPQRRYKPIGFNDYATLGFGLGCLYSFLDDLHTWFDRLTIVSMVDILLLQRPLLVSYQGTSFAAHLMWQGYVDALTESAQAPMPSSVLQTVRAAWQDLWDDSYDLLEEILAADPATRFDRDALSLHQLCLSTLGRPRLLAAIPFASLWRGAQYAQALCALQFDVWAVKAMFERICNRQVLTLGNARTVPLPLPSLLPGTR